MRVRRLPAVAVLVLLALVARPLSGSIAPATAAPAHNTSNLIWSIEPLRVGDEKPRLDFALSGKAGDVLTTTARVTNSSDQVLPLRLYVADAFNTDTGSIEVRQPDDPAADVAAWTTLDRGRVELDVGQHVDVAVQVTIPADVEPGDHVGGIAAALDGAVSSSDGHRLEIERRVRTLLTVRVAGPVQPSLTVEDLQVRVDPAGSPLRRSWVSVSYVVRNTGNVRLGATQEVAADGLLRRGLARHTVDDLPDLLPGQAVNRVEDVGHLRVPARVRAEVRLRPRWPAGGPEIVAGAAAPPTVRATTATRWSTPWLIGELLALVVALAWLLRRRYAKHPDALKG